MRSQKLNAVKSVNSRTRMLRKRETFLAQLRRILFHPKQLVGAGLSLVLLFAAPVFAGDIVLDPTADQKINDGDTLKIGDAEWAKLNSSENDPSKTFTLNGGTFVWDVDGKGDLTNIKKWAWGDKQDTASTIEIKQQYGALIVNKPITLTQSGLKIKGTGSSNVQFTGTGANFVSDLTIEGAELNLSENIESEGSVDINGGQINVVTGNFESRGSLKVQDGKINVTTGNIDIESKNPIDLQNSSINVTTGNIGIKSDIDVQDSQIKINNGNFKSESLIGIEKGNLSIELTTDPEIPEKRLELSLADLNIVNITDKEKGVTDNTKRSVELSADSNGIVKMNGTVKVTGAGNNVIDEKTGKIEKKDSYSTLKVKGNEKEGETLLTGTLTNTEGGYVEFENHVTISGDGEKSGIYKSSSIDQYIEYDDKGNPLSYSASDYFKSGLTLKESAWIASRDMRVCGKFRITGNASSLLYGESRFDSTPDKVAPHLYISGNGEMRGTVENCDVDTTFEGEDGTVGYGKLIFGNFNDVNFAEGDEPSYIQISDRSGRNPISHKMNYLGNTIIKATKKAYLGDLDYIHQSTISGAGTIEISTAAYITPEGQKDVDQTAVYATIFAGDKTGFTGNTDVKIGSLVLYSAPGTKTAGFKEANFQYGTDELKGIFTVYGEQEGTEEGTEDETKKILNPGTDGQLAFWRSSYDKLYEYKEDQGKWNVIGESSLTDAPILNANIINFQTSQDQAGNFVYNADNRGAKIFFNTNFQNVSVNEEGNLTYKDDRTNARSLGVMNANKINFCKSNFIWYDDVSLLDSSAIMTITLNSPEITVTGTDGQPITIDESNKAELESIFDKAAIKSEATAIKSGSNITGYTISNQTMTFAQFERERNASADAINGAAQVDNNLQEAIKNGKDRRMYEAMYNETDPIKLEQSLRNLTRYSGPAPFPGGSYGSVVSPFCPMGGLTGTSRRGQSLEEPIKEVDQAVNEKKSESVFNQNSGPDKKRTVWAAFSHTSINAYGYTKGENILDGYDVRRSGIIGGVKKVFDDTFSGGLFFAYSNWNVDQCGTYEPGSGNYSGIASNYSSGMDNCDFQFAAHFEKVYDKYWETAFYLGGGTYSADWERNMNDTTTINPQAHHFVGETTGNNLTFTAYLARRLEMTENWNLRPTIGLDSEHSWLFGFDEERVEGCTYDPSSMILTSHALHYDTIQYSRNTARAGIVSTWADSQGRGGITGRAFYGIQLGGKYAPIVDYRSLDNGSFWSTADTAGCFEMGGESLNLGLGGYRYLNKKKTLSVTADINGIWYKNATTQNVTAGVSWIF